MNEEHTVSHEQILTIAQQVVHTVQQTVDLTLDYTGTSLPHLEQYISTIIKLYGGLDKLEADGKLLPLGLGFSFYFGETVRRSIGGFWILHPEERMTVPFLRFDASRGAANTANLNIIATTYDFMREPDSHAIVYAFVTYDKIYRGEPPYDGVARSAKNLN